MARVHLCELHDQPWFPPAWRDLLTDYLSFYARVFRPYECVAPLLAEALQQAGARRIVDLCSGSGEAVLSLRPGLERSGLRGLTITLTDKYPNPAAWRRAAACGGGAVDSVGEAVDATRAPRALHGFRTLFTSLHHFRPHDARAVLADAAAAREGIAAFEYTERNFLVWGLPLVLIPAFVWITTPFMRPFSWRRLLWTYPLPVVPLVAMWDGFVSCLRTYSPRELEALVCALPDCDMEWRIGRVRSVGLSRVTWLIGTPAVSGCSSGR